MSAEKIDHPCDGEPDKCVQIASRYDDDCDGTPDRRCIVRGYMVAR